MKYYSQYKQDQFIDEVVLNRKKNGFFIDIGAHDGITFSNTYFFEKNRDFNGICIEPNPGVFSLLKSNRLVSNLNVCIGSENGKAQFLVVDGYGEMLSCIYNPDDVYHMDRIDDIIRTHGGSKNFIDVEVLTFEKIRSSLPSVIDFCSIDTEGYELEILQVINFDTIDIKVFSIEANDDDTLLSFMQMKNYVPFIKLSCDIIFVKKNLINLSMRIRLGLFILKRKINSFMRKINLFKLKN